MTAVDPVASRRSRWTAWLSWRARRWLLGGLALTMAAIPQAMAAPADAASLHAAYVINFVRYTRWPVAKADGPLVIAVLGAGDASTTLAQLARRAGAVEGRPLRVRRLSLNPIAPSRAEAIEAVRESLSGVHVVYVAASHQSWNEAVIAAAKGQPVLTVGVGGRFVAAGGMFGLVQDGGRVHITANEAVVRQASIDVSARVLLLARSTQGP